MIKNIFKILFIISGLYSCKNQEVINVNELISDYSLESLGDYNNGKRLEKKWISKDSTLTFTLYENLKTKHFLYLVQNKNKDTIYKFFDSTTFELKIRDFVKINNNYFITLWDSFNKKYIGRQSKLNGKNAIYESLFAYDSLNIYKIDTLSYQLIKINKPSIENIKEIIKGKDFKIFKKNSKVRLIRDTLNNQKVLYEYDIRLEIKKSNHKYSLKPFFLNESKIKLDENNFSSYTDRFLMSKNFKGDIRYYNRFDIEYNNIGYSKIDFVFHQSDKEHIIKTSLDNLFILDKEYKKKNINPYNSLQIEPFKYKNGAYFFYLSQQSEYWSENFPLIYHIDTIHWRIKRVLNLNIKRNENFKKLMKTQEIENLSTIHKSRLNFILENFEIIKKGNEYKLIKNK